MTVYIPGWERVEAYQKNQTIEAVTLAIIEAEKIIQLFVRNAQQKGETFQQTLQRIAYEYADAAIKLNTIAQSLVNEPGYQISDYYHGCDLVDQYKMVALRIVQSKVSIREHEHALVVRFKKLYFLYGRRARRIAINSLVVTIVLLFIADTQLGRVMFEFVIDQIHRLLASLLIAAFGLVVLSVLFVAMASAVDSIRGKKKKRR